MIRVLLLVAHQFQRHCPRPRNGDEREAAPVEDRLGLGSLRSGGGVEDGIIDTALLIVGQGERHISMSFNQSAPKLYLRAVSAMLA